MTMIKENVKTIKWLFSQLADEMKQTAEVLNEDNIDTLINFVPEENEFDFYYIIKEAVILSTLPDKERFNRLCMIEDEVIPFIEASLETSTLLASQCKYSDSKVESKINKVKSDMIKIVNDIDMLSISDINESVAYNIKDLNANEFIEVGRLVSNYIKPIMLDDTISIRKFSKLKTIYDLLNETYRSGTFVREGFTEKIKEEEDRHMKMALEQANKLAKTGKIETDKPFLAEPKLDFSKYTESEECDDFDNYRKIEFLTLEEVKEKYPEEFQVKPTDKEQQMLLEAFLQMVLLDSLAIKLKENVDNPVN